MDVKHHSKRFVTYCGDRTVVYAVRPRGATNWKMSISDRVFGGESWRDLGFAPDLIEARRIAKREIAAAGG